MTDNATEKPKTEPSSWRDKTLKAAGFGYTIGDLAMARAATLRGQPNALQSARLWLAGGIAATIFGNPNSHRQMEILAGKLDAHLREHGIEVPDDIRAQHTFLKKPDFVDRCINFLYAHPSEMLNAAYAVGAAYLLKDGIRDLRNGSKGLLPKLEGGWNGKSIVAAANSMSKDFWMGALVGGGAISGLFIKEDPKAHEKATHGNLFEKAGAFIKEKPLRLTGTLYGLNNVFTVLKAYEDYSNRNDYKDMLKPYHFSGTTAATYILSNILLTTVTRDQASSKTMPADTLTRMEAAAVAIVTAQPLEKRQALVSDLAQFLSEQKGVSISAVELQRDLEVQLKKIANAPETGWTVRETARQEEAATALSK